MADSGQPAPPPYLLAEHDRALFLRCRRAWDLGAGERHDLVPVRPESVVDLIGALRAALAVYYFPGMWAWDRSVVEPRALERFGEAMVATRRAFEQAHGLQPADKARWDEANRAGERLLDAYGRWAPSVDAFTPAGVELDYRANLIDPERPGRHLRTDDGREVRFEGRVPLLVADADDRPWVVRHDLVEGSWPDTEILRLDDSVLVQAWGWGACYLRLPAGEIRNLMAVRPIDGEQFRRVVVERTGAEFEEIEERLALEVIEMTTEPVSVRPQPAPEHCASCVFREPCRAMNERDDAGWLLSGRFHARPTDPQGGRLGDRTWSIGRGAAPPTFDA